MSKVHAKKSYSPEKRDTSLEAAPLPNDSIHFMLEAERKASRLTFHSKRKDKI
ncbi:hypothetical protein [Mesotoga prima]|uniref:hypothetical protein n=1 Tax=Mesotoga prima TaxID=1184387 RepID=UPI0003A3FC3E|nr:hypothetical protein [Thermotogota bacterium]